MDFQFNLNLFFERFASHMKMNFTKCKMRKTFDARLFDARRNMSKMSMQTIKKNNKPNTSSKNEQNIYQFN